jgi:hypothetical protein
MEVNMTTPPPLRFIPRENADRQTIERCHILNYIDTLDLSTFHPTYPNLDGPYVNHDITMETFHTVEFNNLKIDFFVEAPTTPFSRAMVLVRDRYWSERLTSGLPDLGK